MLRIIILPILLAISLLLPPAQPGIAPRISNLKVLTPEVAVYDRIELRFDVRTSAGYTNLPYDPTPPTGLESVSGISVDAIFTTPDGRRVTQPAFFYQAYTNLPANSQDGLLPDGRPQWQVRFTPQQPGTWRVRIRAVDADGMSLSGETLVEVRGASQNPNRAKGFLRVSTRDRRYFEFADGSPFHPVGLNDGFDSATGAEQRLAQFEENGINLVRAWMSAAGINGSQWTAWSTFYLPFDGYLPPTSLESKDVFPGHELAYRLDSTNPCLFQGWLSGPVAVQPDTTYRVWARVKVQGVGAEGFVIKTGDWLEKRCEQAGEGRPLTQPLSGSSNWTEVSGALRTAPGQTRLDFLYLARQSGSGTALVDEVRLYEENDALQRNLLADGRADAHLVFEPAAAARWDAIIQSAEEHGVYLKLVIDEKNEWIRNRINAEGQFTTEGDNNNFYAAPGRKVRWLQQAWWRYVIARWGYSTAIHSFEYINEGDPYNGNHYEAANSMARYFHRWDPSRHMVTTSMWASFPNKELWSNPDYGDLDYADLHAYLSTGWPDQNASFVSTFALDTSASNQHNGLNAVRIDAGASGATTITPRGLVLREKGEWLVRYWMKARGFQMSCPYNTSGGMQRVRWSLDGGTYNGGREAVVPTNSEGSDFVCTAPDGTYDWQQFRSDRDNQGQPLAEQFRLVIQDEQPHEIALSIENASGTRGSAWISQVELVSPSGRVTPVIGAFDATRFDDDTAWYNAAYGLLLGANSPVGAGMPLMRGEAGLDDPQMGGYLANLNRDKDGVWLHNNVWAQLGPGGMTDLMWWTSETIMENAQTGRVPGLLPVYRTYRDFVEGIPLNNGQYHDAKAQTSDPRLRAWGQRDDASGQAHLWIQNREHTWRAVADGKRIPAVAGSVLLTGMPPATYRVEWWDTYTPGAGVIKTEVIASNGGMLVLALPQPLVSDIAVKITRQRN